MQLYCQGSTRIKIFQQKPRKRINGKKGGVARSTYVRLADDELRVHAGAAVGRIAMLARPFRVSGLGVVGVQESRVGTDEPSFVGSYRVLSAPCAPGGRLGT